MWLWDDCIINVGSKHGTSHNLVYIKPFIKSSRGHTEKQTFSTVGLRRVIQIKGGLELLGGEDAGEAAEVGGDLDVRPALA